MLQQLAPQYIQTGKAKIIYHNFPIIGPESVSAAEAAECAADQGKFWAYANDLFAHQGGENSGAFSNANLKAFAAQLGLNPQTFGTCFDGGKYAALVQQQLQQGQQRGVQATPTFFINGQKFEGVLSYNQLVAQINAGQ
ncbi:MAG: DsbA family protein [Chloroflexi bacterium]|nr:DsbA family protein [Chloroflexota bacterium]